MLYTALGDSITAGELATSPARAYPSLITTNLRAHRRGWFGEVLAAPGWTSQTLNAAVWENGPLPLRESNVISIWVGGDNLADAALAMLHGARTSILKQSLLGYTRSLGALITGIRRVSRAGIVVCTQYNPFPNTPIAAQGIAALNEATSTVAASAGAIVAPVHQWFEGRQAELIAGYRTGTVRDVFRSSPVPIHPNDRGHRVIATGLTPILANAHTPQRRFSYSTTSRHFARR